MPVDQPRIPPVDWRQEMAEREAEQRRVEREARAARTAPVSEELPARRPPPRRQEVQVGEAPLGPRPNLEQAKAWQAEQLKGSRP